MTRPDFSQFDDELAVIDARLVAFQRAYIGGETGFQYWQGLLTHSVVPADGESVLADRQTLIPVQTQSPKSWASTGVLPTTMKIAFRVDVYLDRRGRGWTLTGLVTLAGQLWSKTLNHGHLLDRESDWSL